jgi:hypothetical protein
MARISADTYSAVSIYIYELYGWTGLVSSWSNRKLFVYSSLCIVHCVQFIVYSSLCTLHCVHFIVYSSLRTVHCVQFIVNSSLCTVIVNSSLCTVHCVQFIVHSSLCTVHCVQLLCTVHCEQFIVYNYCLQFMVYSSLWTGIVYSPLCTGWDRAGLKLEQQERKHRISPPVSWPRRGISILHHTGIWKKRRIHLVALLYLCNDTQRQTH